MSEQPHPPHDAGPTSAEVLRRMVGGYRLTQLLYVAAKLGIADLLHDGPKNCETLAQSTQTQPRALYRVLRALASLGVFEEDQTHCFHITPLADFLRTEAPESLRDYAIFYGEEWIWRAEGALLYSVQTGEAAFNHVHGMGPFDYYNQHAEAAAGYNAAMTSLSEHEVEAIVAAYDFAGMSTIIDVGGGQGTLLAAILKSHPQVNGILFDRPAVIDSAQSHFGAEGVEDRCTRVAGDFFESIPDGGNVYILKHIIHDWDDAFATRILTQCRRAMAAQSRLLVMERIIPPGNAPSVGKLADITMLVHYGGLERTDAEYRELFAAAGLSITRIVGTQTPLSIIEGMPI